MSERPLQLPVLRKVRIRKNGNKNGSFFYLMEGVNAVEKPFDGSLPFSRLTPRDMLPFLPLSGEPDSYRMNFAEQCLALIIHDSQEKCAPVRFRDVDGTAWKVDGRVLSWLLGSGRYELVEKSGFRDYGIRPRRG